jgi:hypothetical protein
LSNDRLLTWLTSILAPSLSPQQLEQDKTPVILTAQARKEFGSMFAKSKIIISAAIILAAVSAALAKDGGLPKLKTDYNCRVSEKALSAENGATSDIESCISDENDARKTLEKDWATYPASGKAQCIQPKEYTPGYIEWLTCLEMDRDVRVLRKGQPEISSSVDKCPIVRYRQDGTIVSVNAC